MSRRIVIIFTLISGFLVGFEQQYAPTAHYLVDSLPYHTLPPSEQRLVDSVLEVYHTKSTENQLNLINLIVETSWDNRVWPKYNQWIMTQLESRKETHALDSADAVLYAGCLINQGYYYRVLGDIKSALTYYQKSYDEYEKLDHKEGLAFCLNNMGVVYDNLGEIPKALECYHKSLSLQEEIGAQEGEANSLSNIGEVHRILGDLDKALDFFQQSLTIQKAIDNKRGEAMTLVKIGDIHAEWKDYDTAQDKFEEALKINREIEDRYGIASSTKELGKLFYAIGKYDMALAAIKESKVLFEQYEDKEEIAKSNSLLGQIYFAMDSITLSLMYTEKGYALAEELAFIELISSTSHTLSLIYEQRGNILAAHQFFKKHIKLKDSIRSGSNEKLTIRMQMQHDYDKQKALDDKEKEKEIALANEEKKRQQVVSISIGIVGILTFIFLVIILNRLKITRQQKAVIAETNEELNQTNEEILAQRDEIERQKNLVEDKNNEITASISYAKRIQTAILPPQSNLDEHLPNCFVYYSPKDVVAGDFYWMEERDGNIFFAAADCTGHGVPGAMVSVVCHGALNRCIREYKLTTPSEILDKTRELVIQTFEKSETQMKDGMDISLCVWNKKDDTLQFAGANNPLYFIKKGETTMGIIKGDRQPIGFTHNPIPFTNHKLSINELEALYLFTDGYADQFGGSEGKKLGHKHFREKLFESRFMTSSQQKEEIAHFFNRWKGDEEQVDDVCVIGVKF